LKEILCIEEGLGEPDENLGSRKGGERTIREAVIIGKGVSVTNVDHGTTCV